MLLQAMLLVSPQTQEILSYVVLALALVWLVRHFRRQSRQPGCAGCPQAAKPSLASNKDRVSLPVIQGSK